MLKGELPSSYIYSTNHYSSTKRLKSTYYIIKYSIYKKKARKGFFYKDPSPSQKE